MAGSDRGTTGLHSRHQPRLEIASHPNVEVPARRQSLLCLGFIAALLLFATTRNGEGQAPATDDERAIRQAVAAYADAFNKGDLAALAAFWAADAEYVAEDGTITKGRDAIAGLFRPYFTEADRKGSKMTLEVTSVRVLKGDVALQDGTSAIAGPDGTASPGRLYRRLVQVRRQVADPQRPRPPLRHRRIPRRRRPAQGAGVAGRAVGGGQGERPRRCPLDPGPGVPRAGVPGQAGHRRAVGPAAHRLRPAHRPDQVVVLRLPRQLRRRALAARRELLAGADRGRPGERADRDRGERVPLRRRPISRGSWAQIGSRLARVALQVLMNKPF